MESRQVLLALRLMRWYAASMANTITKKAIEACGGASKLAGMLGITRQAVEQWEDVPPKHVLRVEGASGISRYRLRPDIYGEAPKGSERPLASVAA